jgi:hypothetical protein
MTNIRTILLEKEVAELQGEVSRLQEKIKTMKTPTQFIGGPFDPDQPIPETVTHIHVQAHHHHPREGYPDQPGRIQRGVYERDECGLFIWHHGASLTMVDEDTPIDTGMTGITMGTDRKPAED